MIEPAPAHPLQWSADLLRRPGAGQRAVPLEERAAGALDPALTPRMPQPPLSHHVLVLHLGGDKRVRRSGDGLRRQFDVGPGRGQPYSRAVRLQLADPGAGSISRTSIFTLTGWTGPLSRCSTATRRRWCCRRRSARTTACCSNSPRRSCREVEADRPSRAYLDSMLDAALVQIVQRYSNVGDIQDVARHTLAPARLRRVLDPHRTVVVRGAGPDRPGRGGGSQPASTSARAFQRSVGEPPLAYVARRRIETAKTLLRSSALPVADIAARSGFASASYFSTAFRRHTGHSPSEYRYDKT